ncbi:MAG: hypothetical protein EON59_06480 [Alphaproteobacteria bacterium]|nr:MAG: hypothetical protein EON59_06480 [Alphaproteobacteria bacterium]
MVRRVVPPALPRRRLNGVIARHPIGDGPIAMMVWSSTADVVAETLVAHAVQRIPRGKPAFEALAPEHEPRA